MSVVVFDEWRQDLVYEDVYIANVLFVRATKGDEQYHTPVFEEDDKSVADVKKLLMRRFGE